MKISRVIDLFLSQLAKHLTLVFAGNVFAAGLGFLTLIIISRHITVSDFGFFNIAISIIIIAPLLASIGMDTSMIKFASSYLSRDQEAEAVEVLKTSFRVRIFSSTVLAG